MQCSWVRSGRVVGIGLATVLMTFSLQPSRTIAQDGNVCFFQAANGQVVNLDGLCGTGSMTAPASRPANAAPTANSTSSVIQARIKYRAGKAPVIDVVFNGQRTFEMIVDTGADGTLITAEMATALNIPITSKGEFEMADGRVVELPIGQVRSMSVQGAEVRNIEVAISPQSQVGLLGHDFFDKFDVKIGQNVVEFYRR